MDLHELERAIRRTSDQLQNELRNGRLDTRYLQVRDLLWSARGLADVAARHQLEWKKQQTGPITKWDLMPDWMRSDYELSFPSTPYTCGRCGWTMETEAAFARHYVVRDIAYPNLGECWTQNFRSYADSRPEWPIDAVDAAECIDLKRKEA